MSNGERFTSRADKLVVRGALGLGAAALAATVGFALHSSGEDVRRIGGEPLVAALMADGWEERSRVHGSMLAGGVIDRLGRIVDVDLDIQGECLARDVEAQMPPEVIEVLQDPDQVNFTNYRMSLLDGEIIEATDSWDLVRQLGGVDKTCAAVDPNKTVSLPTP